ncbi:hypothetical protein VTI74DRAFT_241 [Chaetomium olivicolor]
MARLTTILAALSAVALLPPPPPRSAGANTRPTSPATSSSSSTVRLAGISGPCAPVPNLFRGYTRISEPPRSNQAGRRRLGVVARQAYSCKPRGTLAAGAVQELRQHSITSSIRHWHRESSHLGPPLVIHNLYSYSDALLHCNPRRRPLEMVIVCHPSIPHTHPIVFPFHFLQHNVALLPSALLPSSQRNSTRCCKAQH